MPLAPQKGQRPAPTEGIQNSIDALALWIDWAWILYAVCVCFPTK